MLHQTLLTFRPFPSSSSSSSSSSTSYPPSYSSSINPLLSTNTSSSKVDMEVMKKDMFYYDSVHDNNNNNNKGFLTEKVEEEEGCIPLPEEFQVDDLLDLRGLPESEEEEEEEEVMDVARVSFSNEKTFITASQNEPIEELYSEITLHETDAASLEWLSHFFDECSTEFPSPTPPSYIGIMSPSLTAHQAPLLNATTLIPVRAKRSKRLRGNGLLWCRNSQLRLPDSSSASSITTFSTTTTTASPSSSSSSSSSFNSYISYEPSPFACFLLDDNSAIPKPNSNPKKRGRRPKNPFAIPAERRCSHCGVHKTPQWRAGPHGAKTLCNACGVRFKSGRLLPEYRPACSPTFVSHVHSNSHRKVLEMRRKKDEEVLIVTSPNPSHVDPTRSDRVNR